VRIRQYSYLWLASRTLAPEALVDRVGVAPDETARRVSRFEDPRTEPTTWLSYVCDDTDLTVGDQIERILGRLADARTTLCQLVADDTVTTGLNIVRYFDDEHGVQEQKGTVDGLERLSGQHQLLGWHVSAQTVAFLSEVRAEIDVDEYG
jgi:hypothetical protein